MKTSLLLDPPLRIWNRQLKEPTSIAEVRECFTGTTPSDVMSAMYIRVLARAQNMSLTTFVQHVTGLSRSQLRQGVKRQATLDRGMQRRMTSMRQHLRRSRWDPEEIAAFEAGRPGLHSDFATGYADLTYLAFFGFGGGEEAISHALEIDRLIWDLDCAYREGAPPSHIAEILRDCPVFDTGHFDRPEGQLVADYSERQALAELGTNSSWDEAMPLIGLIGIHCMVSLLAMFDISIQRYLGPDWSDPVDGSVLTRLFPRLSPRAAVETGRPSRRGLVELPVARLLDFSVRLIYRCRNDRWPRERTLWRDVARWTKSTSAGVLAQWRSGQNLMTAAEFAQFWEEASCTPKRRRHPPPVPMPLYLAAIMLETLCVTWQKGGQYSKVLTLKESDYNARRQRLMEARGADSVRQTA